MMQRIAHILFFASLLTLFGCASQKLDFDGREPSPELLNDQLTQSWDRIDRLESSLTLRVQNKDFSGSLFGTLYLNLPDQLSLTLKAPFGIKVGELTISDGKYEAKFATGQFDYGNVEDFDLGELTGIPFPANDLLRIFEPLARPVFDSFHDSSTLSFEITDVDSFWQWRVAETELDHQILYNPVKGWVSEERWFEKTTGELALLKEYSETDRVDDVPLANELQIESGGAYPTKVRIEFETLELNPEWKFDPFLLKAGSS
jgi:outer membrane biogenesis lipoprotein LolB